MNKAKKLEIRTGSFLISYFWFRLVRVRGLTQIQLAEILGKPQSYVSKYERGERRLDVIEFLEVVKVLDIDTCEIIKQLETQNS